MSLLFNDLKEEKIMIRVLHCVGLMNRGGIETMLMNLYRNINRNKVQFDFLTISDEEGHFDKEIYELGGRIYNVKSRRQGVIKNRLDLNRFFKEHKEYNTVHMHLSSLTYIEPLIIAKKYNVKNRIIHSHNTKGAPGLIHSILHNINRLRIDQIVTHKFACSKEAGFWLFGKDVYGEKVNILNNAIDTKIFNFNKNKRNEVRRGLSIQDRFVIGHVGRFSNQKNHSFIIDIFHEIYLKNKNAVLMLVGDGNLQSEIRQKVNRLGLTDSVLFLGIRSDIPDLLQAMDVFLFPSLYEGLPVTLIEAQAAGLKVIASDSISNEVKITNQLEFNSLSENAKVWSQKVLNYSNGYDRFDMQEKIEKAGYDIDGNTSWLEEFYTSIN
jgi:glycosyltransferase involved in cell wall biosynthesis